MRIAVAVTSFALVAIACSRTKPAPTPAPASGAGPVASAAPAGGAAGAQGAAGAPGAAARRRVPPNPYQQDTVRRAMVDSLLATIAGRENEPAGTVFKNVTLLKDMPAGEFLRAMDSQYGRALGWTCNNCHVTGKFDDDTKKNKKIARQMQVMQNYINGTSFPAIKELDADYEKATCAMCHRGTAEPVGSYPVQALPARAGG